MFSKIKQLWDLTHGLHHVDATYEESNGFSCVYVYVKEKEDFPDGSNVVTEERPTEITLDFDRTSGELLGIEIITRVNRSAVH